jgi:hypothetical protein
MIFSASTNPHHLGSDRLRRDVTWFGKWVKRKVCCCFSFRIRIFLFWVRTKIAQFKKLDFEPFPRNLPYFLSQELDNLQLAGKILLAASDKCIVPQK